MKRLWIVLCMSLSLSFAHATDDRNEVQASLKTVTVYRIGAEMMHIASAQLKAGDNELMIDNISNNIDSNSLQIKAPSSVTILHWEFSKNYLVTMLKPSTRKPYRIQWRKYGKLLANVTPPSAIPMNCWKC